MYYDIENWFTYHAPNDDQIAKYARIRDEAKALAYTLVELVPDGPDKTVAIRSLRETVMRANLAIACHNDLTER